MTSRVAPPLGARGGGGSSHGCGQRQSFARRFAPLAPPPAPGRA
jgi:hypothetical protein